MHVNERTPCSEASTVPFAGSSGALHTGQGSGSKSTQAQTDSLSGVHGATMQGAQQQCSAFAAQYLATLRQNSSSARLLSGALVDKDALRHGMCIGVVASQRGAVGLGYLHQNLASLLSGVPLLSKV